VREKAAKALELQPNKLRTVEPLRPFKRAQDGPGVMSLQPLVQRKQHAGGETCVKIGAHRDYVACGVVPRARRDEAYSAYRRSRTLGHVYCSTSANPSARKRAASALSRTSRKIAAAIASGNYGRALLSGVTDPTTVQKQTSQIIDPPNGRLPELTPEGKRLSALMRSSWAATGETGQTWDKPEDFDSWDRCITRGLPASMGPYRYNNGMQILQAPGMVILNLEMIHEARIIYTDGRPVVNPIIQSYMGESRGRWENGNSLVFTTTNIKPGASMTNIGIAGSPNGNRTPASDKLKLTERITRLGKDMIEYEMTVEDPVVLTRPWTVRMPLKEEPTYEWWEYACHEGNSVIPNYVNASRAERAAAASGGAAPAAPAAPAGGGRQGR